MIFTVLFLYPCLLLESLVNCASIDVGSQYIPSSSFTNEDYHVGPSNSNHRSISNSRSSRTIRITSSDVREIKGSPLANTNNSPHEDRRRRRLKRRQVSTSEWIFLTLVQSQPSPSTPEGGQQSSSFASQNRKLNSLAYRSIAPSVSSSNIYTNYYRNPNIYFSQQQTGRRVDRGDDKHNHEDRDKNIQTSSSGQTDSAESSGDGLGRRRASSLPFETSKFYISGDAPGLPTPKVPETPSTLNYSATTGLSKTAPATDSTVLGTERATSTQEMQISDEDLDLAPRADFSRGKKRGREMSDGGTESLFFGQSDSAPIVFPGRTTTSSLSSNGKGNNLRTSAIRQGTRSEDVTKFYIGGAPAITLNPTDKRHINGWNKLLELRLKSKSIQDGKKSISSDTSADAKIVSILNIEQTPKCAQANNGYCEEIDGYPKTYLNDLLNKTYKLSPDVFQDLYGETIDNNSVFTDVEYSLRDGFDETRLCSVREHTMYPKDAQNRRGQFMYIVNHDEYLQGIRVETCTEKDSCMFTEGHLPGYSSTCKQKYIYKKLLAFSPDGKAMPDTFQLPSCCVCYVKSMFVSYRISPLGGNGNIADIQPTVAADDGFWSPSSSTTLSYPPHHFPNHDECVSSLPSISSSTEPGGDIGSITFPSTSSDDLTPYQVPSPTTSTSSSKLDSGGGGGGGVRADNHQNGGQQQSRAENQTASRRLH